MNTQAQIARNRIEMPDEFRDYRIKAAFDEYLATGWLPGNHDTSHVDDRMTENAPGLLDKLITAATDSELLVIAKLLRDERIAVIDEIIMDNLGANQ